MIDHISIGVSDIARSAAFYDAVLATLGHARMEGEWPRSVGYGKRHPEFWINARPGRAPVPHDSGLHICLRARSTGIVDAFHAAAMEAGAVDDGPPGIRPEYADNYYAAFLRDPDGHRIEVVTFVQDDGVLPA